MSKLILFDFVCPKCEHSFEDMVQPSVWEAPCPKCGANARRQVSAPRIDHMSMALSPHAGPETLKKYDRVRRERKALEERRYAEHGDYGPSAGAD